MIGSLDWQSLNDRFYWRRDVCSLHWDVDVETQLVAAAPFGGVLATTRDQKKLSLLRMSASVMPTIEIYNCAGRKKSSIPWRSGRLVGMGWTRGDSLLCVADDGTCLLYSIHGELVSQFSLGRETTVAAVEEAIIWEDGLVARLGPNTFVAVLDLKLPRPVRLATPNIYDTPDCMAVIPPQVSRSRSVEVILSCEDSLFLIDTQSAENQMIHKGKVLKLAVSPKGDFVACYTDEQKLLVMSTDFADILSEFPTECPPDVQVQLCWCGVDSVLIECEASLWMVGPFGDSVVYTYDDPVVLLPELDGVRILSGSKIEFLQRVPDATSEIFTIGSTSPGALLYDAFEKYEDHNIEADDNVRTVGPDLPHAISLCIEAACHELDPIKQKSLLRAAVFGHAFAPSVPPSKFQQALKVLRIINQLRKSTVGLVTTIVQYEEMGNERLVHRLVKMHLHYLALKIAGFLSMQKGSIVEDWASSKIKLSSTDTDEDLSQVLLQKCQQYPDVSYAKIAEDAFSSGRRELAAILLEYEKSAEKQIPLLLRIGEVEAALSKAEAAADPDLIFQVLFHVWDQEGPDLLLRIIQQCPYFKSLFYSYASWKAPDQVKNYFFTSGNYGGFGQCLFDEAFSQDAIYDAAEQAKILAEAKDYFDRDKDLAFEAQTCAETARLIRFQDSLDSAAGQRIFSNTALVTTVRNLYASSNPKALAKLAKDFKLSDKKMFFLKIRALAEAGLWDGLEKMGREKRSPVGWQPFVDVCVEGDNLPLAAEFIGKLPDLRKQAEEFEKIGYMEAAQNAAAQAKDEPLLNRIRANMPGSILQIAEVERDRVRSAVGSVREHFSNFSSRQSS